MSELQMSEDYLYTRYGPDGDIIDGRDEEIRNLKTQIHVLETRARLEEALRMKYHCLRDAYKKYQVLLKFAEAEEKK